MTPRNRISDPSPEFAQNRDKVSHLIQSRADGGWLVGGPSVVILDTGRPKWMSLGGWGEYSWIYIFYFVVYWSIGPKELLFQSIFLSVRGGSCHFIFIPKVGTFVFFLVAGKYESPTDQLELKSLLNCNSIVVGGGWCWFIPIIPHVIYPHKPRSDPSHWVVICYREDFSLTDALHPESVASGRIFLNFLLYWTLHRVFLGEWHRICAYIEENEGTICNPYLWFCTVSKMVHEPFYYS